MRPLSPVVCSILIAGLLAGPACSARRAANVKAKQRIFSHNWHPPPTPAQIPIDVDALPDDPGMRDRVLEMTETEAAERLGSFRLTGKLTLTFTGPAGKHSLVEDRLLEQSADGSLRLRLLEDSGGGMEVIAADGKSYGRSRYGPFFTRDRDSELPEQREEVFGALRTLYLESDRAWNLTPLDNGTGRSCRRFSISGGQSRPPSRPERFAGRLDPDTAKRFQFLYARQLERVAGEICVDPRSGAAIQARVDLRWSAKGDAGSGEVGANLVQALHEVGSPVHVAIPENPQPVPHRPRGPAATLSRFGFGRSQDAGISSPGDGNE